MTVLTSCGSAAVLILAALTQRMALEPKRGPGDTVVGRTDVDPLLSRAVGKGWGCNALRRSSYAAHFVRDEMRSGVKRMEQATNVL
jgi:hypothetical protein